MSVIGIFNYIVFLLCVCHDVFNEHLDGFNAPRSSGFNIGKSRSLTLPDDSSAFFTVYQKLIIQWLLYKGRIIRNEMDALYVNYPSPVPCVKSTPFQYNPPCNFHASKYYGYRSLIPKLDHYIVYFPFVFTLKSLFTYNHRLPYIYTFECACCTSLIINIYLTLYMN